MNAAQLKQSLKRMGWSQKDLAERVGMHPNSISKMVKADKVSNPVAAYLNKTLALKEIAQ